MARSIGMAAEATVYRAVIWKQYPGREPFVSYEGPYGTKAAAKARVTFWKNYMNGTDVFGNPTGRHADGYVEQGTVTWSRVDT